MNSPSSENLLQTILQERNLFQAWEKVRSNKGMAGVDGQTIEVFSHNVFGKLLTLKHMVERGEYKPAPLKEVALPKPDGRLRRLAVPTVRDRVLQTATALVLGPLIEKELEDASFAYRVGRSVPMAVARVAWYRDQGYQWVVDADIQAFFDEINHELLLAKLRKTLTDHSPLSLIELWLSATLQPADGSSPQLIVKGVPQGSPISPLLSNLYLDDFDEALLRENMRLVRFADDFLILCKDQAGAEQAMALTEDVIKGLKLNLKQEKTRITHFDQGFRFLGVEFIRNLLRPEEQQAATWVMPDADQLSAAAPSEAEETQPAGIAGVPAGPDPEPVEVALEAVLEQLVTVRDIPAEEALEDPDPGRGWHVATRSVRGDGEPLEPLLRGLVITEHGYSLIKDGERIGVLRKGQQVASIPIHKLDHVLIHGNCLVSTALLRHAGQRPVSWHFAEPTGRIRASLHLHRREALELQKHQFRRQDEPDFALMIGRAAVAAKIHNQRALLRRLNRRRDLAEVWEAERHMSLLQDTLATRDTLDKVRGIEGACARAYFVALKALLPEQWGFSGRRKRPPEDPFNVLLSYGYGVLFSQMHSLVERRGLHPMLGHLHATNGRHEALVSDLMEEFRTPIVEQVAIQALLRGTFDRDCFVWEADAELPCRMTERARRQYLSMLQTRVRSQVVAETGKKRSDMQRIMHRQVWHYARVVRGEEPVYKPYRLKG
ncbi:MAG: CRISPR-associated endonuclease Cas1 [Halothiobacillaceae bacterium]